MGTKKLLLFSILLVFFLASVSARSVSLYVEVKNATSPNNVVSSATVWISGYGTSWQRTTNSDGITEPFVTLSLPVGTYYYDINVTAPGFDKKVITHSLVQVNWADEEYKITTAFLNAGQICNYNGTCDAGENTANCPEDCALASGLVQDIQLVIPSSGQTDVQCPSGYSNKGSFYDVVFNSLHKLCVKYSDLGGFTPNAQYVKTAYLQARAGENLCAEGDSPIRSFSGGGVTYTLCVGKANIEDLSVDQYASDVIISGDGSCPSSYNVQSTSFYDHSNGFHKLCTRIQNSAGSGTCTLSEPKWVDTDLVEQSNVVGWVGTDTTNYIHGISDLFLYAKATGCQQDTVKFEVWEGPSQNPSLGQKYTVLSPASWQADGYKYFLWEKPQWFAKQGPGIDPQDPRFYSFKAMVESSTVETSFSPTLTIQKPSPAECHYSENSNADDAECENNPSFGIGYVCLEDNSCSNNQCNPNEPNSCPNGFCDAATSKCVECYNDQHCKNSAAFGEGYICSQNKCVSEHPCTLTNLRWMKSNDNTFDINQPVRGWLSLTDWMCGDTLNLVADAIGCEAVDDVAFVIYEKNGFMNLPTDENGDLEVEDFLDGLMGQVVIPQRTANSRYFTYSNYKPSWDLTLESILLNSGEFNYEFYAASLNNPSIILSGDGVGDSPTLKVIKPEEAQCHKSSSSNDCGAGKRCNDCNACVNECKTNSDCGSGELCATSSTPGVQGTCYDCFTDAECDQDSDEKYCSPTEYEPPFTCVECTSNSQCPDEGDRSGVCRKGECTTNCEKNEDCSGLEKKKICSKDKICVECTKNSECGAGKRCDTKSNTCGSGLGGLGGLLGGSGGGIIFALLGVFVGMMFMGPMGALLGGALGLLLGGGFGGGEAGGLLGRLDLGGILEMVTGLF